MDTDVRLVVLGNALLLLRVDPVEVHRWFPAMLVDAYDGVMVPNVRAMSQIAAGTLATAKSHLCGSRYLLAMSDLSPGDWTRVWDGLYWTFVADHLDVVPANPRTVMIALQRLRTDSRKQATHQAAAAAWLEGVVDAPDDDHAPRLGVARGVTGGGSGAGAGAKVDGCRAG